MYKQATSMLIILHAHVRTETATLQFLWMVLSKVCQQLSYLHC